MTSFDLNVESNYREVAELLTDAGGKLLTQARVSATNKTLRQVKTGVRKDISADSGLPSTAIGKRIKFWKATYKRPDGGRVFIGTYRFPVAKVGAKVLKKGVSYPGPGRKRIKNPRAFQAQMPSGHRGIFERKATKRLPIEEVKVSILSSARRTAERHTRRVIPEKFPKIFQNDFQFRVAREIERRRLRATR